MNDGLEDAVRHNCWANRELLEFCRDLNEGQLNATVVGTYGTVIDTLWHIIAAEANYLYRLSDEEPSWDRMVDAAPDVPTIARYYEELVPIWERFLEKPFNSERIVVGRSDDGRVFNIRAGITASQAAYHGADHRSQICTILTTSGFEPPDLQVWSYAQATGRHWERTD